MKFKLYIVLVLLFTSVINMHAYAEDIELYVNKDANSDEKPRVLLIFDTSGSMAFLQVQGMSVTIGQVIEYYALIVGLRLLSQL